MRPTEAALSRQAAQGDWRWGLALACSLALGLVAGAMVGASAGSPSDQELMPLLRLMAAVKLAATLGAAALLHWRLRRPAPAVPAALATGSVGLMAVSPGMVWAPAHLLAAGGLFYAGLLTLLVLAWRDRDVFPTSRPTGRPAL